MINVPDTLTSKKLQTALAALALVVVHAVTGLDIEAINLAGILAILVGLVGNYGLEDLVAAARQTVKAAPERLWQSRRFWTALAGVVVVLLMETTAIDGGQVIELFGLSLSLLEWVVLFVISAVTGINLQDLGEAWNKSGVSKSDA